MEKVSKYYFKQLFLSHH